MDAVAMLGNILKDVSKGKEWRHKHLFFLSWILYFTAVIVMFCCLRPIILISSTDTWEVLSMNCLIIVWYEFFGYAS